MDAQVHDQDIRDQAEAVLRFWLEETSDTKRWIKNPAFDAEIRARFAALRETLLANKAAGWRDDPRTLLAAVILIDQFSRNMFRGDARAFEGDALALSLAEEGVMLGYDGRLTDEQRSFLYMPFMHAEDESLQRRSVELFATINDRELKFAQLHADQIERFGRFPQRNAALGRETTPEEAAFLREPGSHF